MTPEGLRLLADFSLAAIAAGVGLSTDMIRHARDDMRAPHAEIPAAALRRVWLAAVASAAPSITAAALACGVSRPSVRRACEAVACWENDSEVFEAVSPVAGMTEAAAAVIAGASDLQRLTTLCAIADRRKLAEARASRPTPSLATREREKRSKVVVLDLSAKAKAAGDAARAEHFKRLAVVARPKRLRSRDLHRVRPVAPNL